MTTGAGFNYVQARIQARHGARPDDADWSRLESCESPHAYLEAARSGVFTDWAEGLSSDQGLHELEAALRACWRQYLARVAAWCPDSWQPAIDWCGELTGLPLAAHLARGGAAAAWMDDAAADAQTPAGIDEWRTAWHERMPSADRRSLAGIAAVETAVGDWIEANRDAGQDSPRHAAGLRGRLERRATTIFRRHALEPGAVFAHLVLTGLDLQRFRGGLLRRQAFAGTGVGGQGAS